AARLTRHRPEERSRLGRAQRGHVPNVRIIAAEGDALLERRRLLGHAHAVSEQDRRLFLLGAGAVDLGPWLTIGHHAVQTDRAGERALAVALALFDVGAPKPPRAVPTLPSEQAADDELLRRVEVEGPVVELAFAQAKYG